MKFVFGIAIFFLAIILSYCQQPAFHKFGMENGLPDVRELGSRYVNDSIYVSFMDGKFYYFDGIKFLRTAYPKSKYYFTNFYSLKKGVILQDAKYKLWYRKTSEEFHEIEGRRTIIVFDSICYSLSDDVIFVFDEESLKWLKKMEYPPQFAKQKLKPFISIQNDGLEKICLKSDAGNMAFDIENGKVFELKSNNSFAGFAFNKQFFYNFEDHSINWEYCDSTYYLVNLSNKYWDIPYKSFINPDASSFSFLVSNRNKKYFYTMDTTCVLNYAGMMDLAGSNISKIREDMYFVTSFGGVYKVNPYISYYTSDNSGLGINISCIVSHNNSIWVAGYGSKIAKLANNKFHIVTPQDYSSINFLPGAKRINKNLSWFFREGDSTMVRLKDNRLKKYFTIIDGQNNNVAGYYIDTLNDGTLALGLNNYGLGIVDSIGDNKVFVHSIGKEKGNRLGNVLTFDQDKKGRIWMGRFSTGIAVYDTKKDTTVTYDYNIEDKKSFGALSMYLDTFDQLWFGTNRGVYMLRNASSFDIFKDNVFDKAISICLPSNDKSSVLAMKATKNYLVTGNLSSLSFIPLKKYNESVENTEIHQYIFGEDINDKGVQQNGMFYDDKRFLWVASIDGVLRIDMQGINLDTSDVSIFFDKIINGNTELQINKGKIEISPVKRNLYISFSRKTNPTFANNIFYDYLLTNSKKDTIAYQFRKNSNSIDIAYLNPGKYNLSVIANKNGIKKDEINLYIHVPNTIGESPWTRAILIALVLIGAIAYVYYRKELIKKQSEEKLAISKLKNEKEKLKVKAILNSFNPHFINNSLHWIQSRYYRDKDMTKMVGRLSDNISYLLDKTKSGLAYHSLQEELKLIQNYITIQKLRFGDSFEYIEPGNKSLINKIIVIVMQVQIHVENAIEHGLRNRPAGSFVKVEIEEDNDYFIITVTDDGIGRKKAKAIGSRGTSSGIKMLKDLYYIFNMNNSNNLKIQSIFEDEIFSKDGEKFGTKVHLKIPKGFVFEI